MKTCQSTGYLLQAIRKLLLGAVTAVVVSSPVYALTPPNDINACFDCHGSTNDIRPLDSGFRNVSTGAFSGNHRTHISTATTVSNVCAVCHGPAPVAMNHRDGKIYLNNGSIKNGTYSKGPFFNQTSVPTSGSCSSVNCHFNTVTPNWGTSPTWSGTKTANDQNINCAGCHSATTLASGTHAKHITAGGASQAACKSCHPDYNALAGTDAFQHATSAARPINVNFSAAPNLGGAYAGGRTATQFLPPGAIAATGSCSALYCHSPGTKSSAYKSPATAPVWGGSMGCTGCHGAQIASFKVITSGSHAAHVMGSGGSSYSQIKCVTCHAATATAGMTISDVSKHVNKSVDVAFANSSSAANGSYNGALAKPASPSSKAPGTAAGSCQNVYCHSSAQHSDGTALQATDYQTATWGNAASGQCGTCHALTGSTDHGGFSGYVKAGPAIASGKHTKHLSYTYGLTDNASNDYRCALCHANDKTAFTTSNPTSGCTTICHNGTTATMHANNKVDVNIANYAGASAAYSGTPKPGDGYGSCTSVYCHSDGQVTPGYVPTVSWSTAGPLACTACHGSATVNSPAGTALSGKHAAHVNPAVNISLGTGNGFGCVECHQKTVANDTTLNATTGTTFHVDKFVEYTGVRAGGPLRYNSATKQCSNFYCHSNSKNGTSVAKYSNPDAWNSGTSNVKCNYCHGRQGAAPAVSYDNDAAFSRYTSTGVPNYLSGAAGTDTANSHRQHLAQMATTDYSNTQVCYSCHSATLDSTTGRAATAAKFRAYSSRHVSGTYNIKFKASIGGTYLGGTGNKNCSATLCHGGTSPKWGANTTNDGCTKCHGTPSATVTATTEYLVAPPVNTSQVSGTLTGTGQVSNNPKVGAHQTHIRFLNGFSNYSTQTFRCENCHGTLPTSTTHITGSSAPAFQGLANNRGAMSPTFSSSNLTCANTYCHNPAASGVLRNAGNTGSNVFPSWTGAKYVGDTRKTQANCGVCHKSPGDAGFQPAGTHTGMTVAATSCLPCHDHEGDNQGGPGHRHMDGKLYGGGNCDSCHGYQSGTWGVSPAINAGGVGAHQKHVAYLTTKRFTVSLAPTTDQYGSAAASWTNVCGVCHTGSTHMNGLVEVLKANNATYFFGTTGSTTYNGVPGTPALTTAKTCSNINCHYFLTPSW